jgi:methyl-accepting chemotaxis protein
VPSELRASTDTVPKPDPTALTTASLLHEIATLKDLLSAQIGAMESGFKRELENVERIIRGVYDEKFASINTQLRERDVRVTETARTSDAALQAALQAAKEAAGKQTDFFTTTISELKQAMTKQLDGLALLINNMANAFDGKVTDVKERIGVIEGSDRGTRSAVHDRQASTFNIANVIGVIIGILGVVIAVVTVVVVSHK